MRVAEGGVATRGDEAISRPEARGANDLFAPKKKLTRAKNELNEREEANRCEIGECSTKREHSIRW